MNFLTGAARRGDEVLSLYQEPSAGNVVVVDPDCDYREEVEIARVVGRFVLLRAPLKKSHMLASFCEFR